MDKVTYKVGILDDDDSKRSLLRVKLKLGVKGNTEKTEKYSDVVLQPIEILLSKHDSIDKIMDFINLNEIDAVFLDYKLASFSPVNFSGVDVAEKLLNEKEDFPIFMITSYEDDLFVNEIFDPYKVINYGRYVNEVDERTEVNFKIIELINSTNKKIKKYEEELLVLIKDKGKNANIDARILELDSKIEKLTDRGSSLSIETKKQLSGDHLIELLKKIDRIIENE